jgi:predicted RNase H-like HicB family nuclease
MGYEEGSAMPGTASGAACYDPLVGTVAMTIEFPLRVVLYPAPDVKGQWIAHGLETDIVTQGDSVEHALAMMADALQTVTSYQTVRRRPALQLRPAPREVWDLTGDAVTLDMTARVAARRRVSVSPVSGPWSLYALVSRKAPASARAR